VRDGRKMRMRSLLLSFLFSSIILASSVIAILATNMTSTSSSSWEGWGGGNITVSTPPTPRIISVTIDKKSIAPGDWITITVQAKNEGGEATEMYIQVGLPFDPPVSDIQIVYTDCEHSKIYPKGSDVWAGYGSYKITTKYPIVEAWDAPWPAGYTRTLKFKVKMPDVDTLTFDVKTTGYGAGVWKYDPSSGMVDQQDEYVRPYLILSKFEVSVAPGGPSQEVEIPIINHNRHPYKKAQPSITVTSFDVTDYGGFTGTISPVSLPSNIPPGSTGIIKISVSAPSTHPTGTYTIQYRVKGTP